MSIFRQVVDVFGQAAYPASPQVTIPFEPREIAFINEDQDDDFFFSLNGADDHGHVFGGDGTTISQRVTRIWLRRGDAGITPTNVAVSAES